MFKQIGQKEIDTNIFKLIGDDYLLISANDSTGSNNIMTASWGMAGVLWNKPVAQIFVRPQRYTHIFLENGDRFALCVFPQELKKAIHSVCGSKSGRNTDKISETGLTAVTEDGYTFFEEADLVLLCKTIYKDKIKPENFLDKTLDKNYTDDYHTFYIGEIEKVFVK